MASGVPNTMSQWLIILRATASAIRPLSRAGSATRYPLWRSTQRMNTVVEVLALSDGGHGKLVHGCNLHGDVRQAGCIRVANM